MVKRSEREADFTIRKSYLPIPITSSYLFLKVGWMEDNALNGGVASAAPRFLYTLIRGGTYLSKANYIGDIKDNS